MCRVICEYVLFIQFISRGKIFKIIFIFKLKISYQQIFILDTHRLTILLLKLTIAQKFLDKFDTKNKVDP
jgi:hypothetical protein